MNNAWLAADGPNLAGLGTRVEGILRIAEAQAESFSRNSSRSYLDWADYGDGTKTLIRTLLVAAPILMPLGFFLSIVRPSDTRPNKLIWLVVAGGVSLVAGTLLLGVGLL